MKDYHKIKAKDIHENILNMFTISSYEIKLNKIKLYLKSGTIQELEYKNEEDARRRHKKFIKYEKKYREYVESWNDDDWD